MNETVSPPDCRVNRGWIFLALLVCCMALPLDGKAATPPLTLINAHSGERLTIDLFDEHGEIKQSTLSRINRFMACRRTRTRHSISPTLISEVYRLAQDFGGPAVILYSGFRHRRVSRLPGSFHIKGMAIDLALTGVSSQTLRDHVLRNYPNAGVGYYPYRPFVHFDVRGHRAFWVDESGPRQAGHYVSDPYAYVLAEREGRAAQNQTAAVSAVSYAPLVAHPSPTPVGPAPRLADIRVLAH